MTVFRHKSVRTFLKRGGHLAMSMSAARLNGLIFLTALASVSTEAVAAYGIGSFLFSTVSLPLRGLRIVVIAQRGQGSEIEKIAGFPEGVLLANLLCLSLFIALPVALTIWGHGLFGDLTLYLVLRGLGLPLVGVNSVLGGYLVRAGREAVLLKITIQAICIWVLMAAALTIIPFAKELYLLGFIGCVSFAVQIYRFYRYVRALGLSRRAFFAFLPDNSWGVGYAIAKKSLAAGADTIVLLSTFWAILTSLGAIDPTAAAYASIGFSITKLFLLPLKSFGLVAGRMLNAPEKGEKPGTTERALFWTIVSICSGVAFLFLASYLGKDAIARFFASGFWQSSATFILPAIAIQFLIEPWASFRAAALKVTLSPFAVLRSLAISLWAAVLPLIGYLWTVGHLTLESTWIIWLLGRLLFAGLLQFQAKNGFIVQSRPSRHAH